MITGTKMTNTGPFWWNGSSKIQIFTDFSTFSVGGRGGQLMLFFWKLIRETQISKPPEATRHHNSTKLLILVPLRADLLCTLYYETPCRNLRVLLIMNEDDTLFFFFFYDLASHFTRNSKIMYLFF